MDILLKNGRIVDFANKFDGVQDLWISDGRIKEKGASLAVPEGARVIDCTGLAVFPGLFDMHVHFRDPGQTHKEDIITGGEAAAAGGVTGVACMPNTIPTVDSAETVRYIIEKAKAAKTKVYPIASVTKGLKGEEICDFAELKAAGAIAVSDDGRPVENAATLAKAMKLAYENGLKVISHCEDLNIIDGGIINKGEISDVLGVKGMDRLSEDLITAREITVAATIGVPIHIAHVSTRGSMEIIRQAVKSGVLVTSETAPHYFSMTDKELLRRDADYRMNPPLREPSDVAAITQGIVDGTIDCIVTDHAPHSAEEKADFEKAPNGVVGLETSLAATLTYLYHTGKITLLDIVRLMCVNPRRILGIGGGALGEGDVADIAVVDLDEEWTVDPKKLHSRSKNSVFKGKTFKGRVKYTILDGKIVYKD